MIDLRGILFGCNHGQILLNKLTAPKTENGTIWKGINFFDPKDQSLLRGIQHPEFNIHGMRRADLKKIVPTLSESALSRQLKRLHVFGLIKRVGGTYRYYMTKLGHVAVAAWERLTTFTIVPTLAAAD